MLWMNWYRKVDKYRSYRNNIIKKVTYNSRNINYSSWGKFLQILDFKAESAGCQIVKINPMNTTKECSNC